MSYDLDLAPRRAGFDMARFAAYFRGRPHYTLEGAKAVYENEDTGVYFTFEYGERNADTPADEPHYPVALNINYFRPSFFIREAEPEVTAFVRAFDCAAFDPQAEVMGDYDAARLVDEWNSGNESAYSAVLRINPDQPIQALPAATLARIWAWNRQRAALREQFGDRVYVPKLMVLLIGDRLTPASVWPDGVPLAVPPIGHFLAIRDVLAPRRWLRKDPRPALADRRAVATLFSRYRDPRHGDMHVLRYGTVPTDIARFVRKLPSIEAEIVGVTNDQVLDRELVEKYRPAR